MKMTAEMIQQIKNTVEDLDLAWNYEYIGVRVQTRAFELGEISHLSHVWDNGDDTGVELEGISTCKVDRLGHTEYYGDHVAIICGNEADYGEDDGELVIRDAEVAAIIC
nr:MAG TPA: hypothetical protein [Caudoviricetes sp.]